jgi:peptide chain release factor 2
LNDPELWNNPDKARELNQEQAVLEKVVTQLDDMQQSHADLSEMLVWLQEDATEELSQEIETEVSRVIKILEDLECQRMFSGEQDRMPAYLEIQSGSGGTEAQDWAEMLLRMYVRWGEAHDQNPEVIEVSAGEVAGIKSATVRFKGDHAYGWLRTETGVHRLVRKSPFDSGNRRHTSFASVFISPEVDDNIEIEINPADLRVDTYRASGAGGQHVNKTDSAVRLTHEPTGTVVQCQNDRSQHKNKAQAMKLLRAKLYELAMQEKRSEQDVLEQGKADISWGSQIRSYVLDTSRIKDLRTGVETANTQAVLDGGIDLFLVSSLKHLSDQQ